MKNKTLVTLKKDLRTMIRDKKSLMGMLIVPILIPIFMFVFGTGFSRMADPERDAGNVVGVTYQLSEIKEYIVSHIDNIEFKFMPEAELESAYEAGDIVAYIILREGTFHVYYDPNNQDSALASWNVRQLFAAYSEYLGSIYLAELGINPERVFNLVQIEMEPLAPNNVLISTIIVMGFTFTIMAITTTAVTSATDAVAGEKERGTLETLLTFPISSKQLVTGKFIANFIACIVTAIICIILALGSLEIIRNMFDIFSDVSIAVNLEAILLSSTILIGFSLLVAGASIAIASYTKSYKEAQAILTPLTFIPMIPIFLDIMGVEITAFWAALPGVGQTMLLREVFTGAIDFQFIWIMLASNVIFIIFILRFIVKLYKSEKILFSLD